MRNVSEIVLRMRGAVAASGDKDLGEHLGGVAASTISMWKTRNSVPYQYIDQLVQETGKTFEWFLNGVGVAESEECYQPKQLDDRLTQIVKLWGSIDDEQRNTLLLVAQGFSKESPSSLDSSEGKVLSFQEKKSA
jgi:hypothetical protein